MATTVTGPIGATYNAVFDGISATLTRVGGVVGYAETGGAIAPDQKTYVTSGGGVLTMEDLKPGRYTLSLSVPISESTSQTKLWQASGVIPADAGDNITLDAFLTANVEPLTPSLVQQAIAARDAADESAGLSQAWAESPTPPDPEDATSKSSKTWAGEAADSASTATTQAGIATTQAGIATTQAGIATTQAGNAASSAAEANTFATQAELAALAAGAPIVISLTDPVPADDTVELLKLDAGLQVYEVVAGAWVLRGWLVGPKFNTKELLFADTSSTLGPDGTVVEYGPYRAVVDSTLSATEVTHAGGVKLRQLPATSGLGAHQSGTGVAALEKTAAAARAISSPVWVVGEQSVTEDFFPGDTGLRGGGGAFDAPARITLSGGASLRFGFENFNAASKGPLRSRYSPLCDLTIRQTSNAPLIKSAEGYYQKIDNVAFTLSSVSLLSPTTPMVQLGATLYNKFTNNYLNHGQGIGIKGIETDYPAFYYGVNASWFEKNNIFGIGTAAHLHGFFAFNYNDIESGGYVNPKVIVGDTASPSVSPMAIIHGNYFEGRAGGAVSTPPPIFEVRSDQGLNLQDNVVYANHISHPDYGAAFMDAFSLVKSTRQQSWAKINGNYLNSPTSGAGPSRALNITTAPSSYIEAIGNQWPSNQDHDFYIDNVRVRGHATTSHLDPNRKYYVQDGRHGIVRKNMPIRDVFVQEEGPTPGYIRLNAGRNHFISSITPGTNIVVSDRANWPGARLTILTAVNITLKHGAGFFSLAKGADCVLPAGRCMEFVVSPSGEVVEIGDYSARL